MGVGELAGSALWPELWWNERVHAGRVRTCANGKHHWSLEVSSLGWALCGMGTRHFVLRFVRRMIATSQFILRASTFLLLLGSTTMCPSLPVTFRIKVWPFSNVKFYTLKSKPSFS